MRVFNLSRALRPKQFSQVVGQELVVKVLCNSLALNKIFPNYIFSGQRGLGKTTCARIFGAAILCQNSQEILKKRSNAIPCLTCQSCLMFYSGKHPDFIEIDAASNPGVENVREILENALLTPVLGQYKIYLIDEVHMLSKAAFNAFLKMLEEPPSTACFLMATTEIQKVPETIRSRALQLLFWPAGWGQMMAFLEQTVKQNNLNIQSSALSVVTQLAEGSFRDALNRLEQISLLESLNSKDQLLACKNLFGVQDSQSTIYLMELLLKKDQAGVVQLVNDQLFIQCDPAKVFQQILETLNMSLELKIAPELANESNEKLVEFSKNHRQEELHSLAAFFWSNEEFFYCSKNKEILLKNLLLRASFKPSGEAPSEKNGQDDCAQKNRTQNGPVAPKNKELKVKATTKPLQKAPVEILEEQEGYQELETGLTSESQVPKINNPTQPVPPFPSGVELKPESTNSEPPKLWEVETISQEIAACWEAVLQEPEIATDKLLVSILKQAKNICATQGLLKLSFASGGEFFKSKIKACERLVLNASAKAFGDASIKKVEISQLQSAKASITGPKEKVPSRVEKAPLELNTNRKPEVQVLSGQSKNKNSICNLDEKQWPKSSLMVNLFEGSVESE